MRNSRRRLRLSRRKHRRAGINTISVPSGEKLSRVHHRGITPPADNLAAAAAHRSAQSQPSALSPVVVARTSKPPAPSLGRVCTSCRHLREQPQSEMHFFRPTENKQIRREYIHIVEAARKACYNRCARKRIEVVITRRS